ncbi:MAG: sterol desaturase family protein [Spirochaetaceae bacterium]
MNNIRIITFISITILIAILEFVIPQKKRNHSRWFRWSNNILIVLLNRLITPLFLLIPIFIIDPPINGLLDLLNFGFYFNFIIGFILLDIIIYFQHRIFHVVPIFWALHKMHHTDRDLDFTSALRFHPLEILLSMLIKLLFVWVIGIDLTTLIIFEISINTFAIFNHGNFRINNKLNDFIQKIIITPNIHRIHHSTKLKECNSNYGTIFIFWDKLFRSIVLEPQLGHLKMNLGVPGYKDKKYQKIHWLIITPFTNKEPKIV